jgi:Fe-S-cluster containining protein
MTGCTRCGICCTEMMIRVPFPTHATAEEHLRARADAERFYRIHGFDVLPSMAGEIALRIPAVCKHLAINGSDTTCNIYETRPEVCRKFECSKCRSE